MNTIIIINILSAIATAASMYGSKQVVKQEYDSANRYFIAGNSTNIAVAISVGNVPLLIGQYMLRYYTMGMLNDKRYKTIMGIMVLVILAILGINTDQLMLSFSAWEFLGTAGAIIGTKRMLAHDFKNMSYWWIIADVIFFYVGLEHMIIGLIIASLTFTLHGCQRLRKEDRTKFNRFDHFINKGLF